MHTNIIIATKKMFFFLKHQNLGFCLWPQLALPRPVSCLTVTKQSIQCNTTRWHLTHPAAAMQPVAFTLHAAVCCWQCQELQIEIIDRLLSLNLSKYHQHILCWQQEQKIQMCQRLQHKHGRNAVWSSTLGHSLGVWVFTTLVGRCQTKLFHRCITTTLSDTEARHCPTPHSRPETEKLELETCTIAVKGEMMQKCGWSYTTFHHIGNFLMMEQIIKLFTVFTNT